MNEARERESGSDIFRIASVSHVDESVLQRSRAESGSSGMAARSRVCVMRRCQVESAAAYTTPCTPLAAAAAFFPRRCFSWRGRERKRIDGAAPRAAAAAAAEWPT